MHSIKAPLFLAALLLSLAACSMPKMGNETAKFGTLTRSLQITDAEGRRYGTLELDPVSGGKMYDVEGRLVGVISSPSY